jgi:hypothetical protein
MALHITYSRRDPVIRTTPILDLRPTQMTVGMREVERKRRSWGGKGAGGKQHALEKHMVPIVLGPDGGRYITDHHHLARALLEDGQKSVFVTLVGDLSKADPENFWNLMDYHGWTHPFDEHGRRCGYEELPKTVKGLKDDPYRALSGALRQQGGFAKDSTPFSEFVWADYFRKRIRPKTIEKDYEGAIEEALRLAKEGAADYLPGWCGPHRAPASADEAKKPKKKGVKAR